MHVLSRKSPSDYRSRTSRRQRRGRGDNRDDTSEKVPAVHTYARVSERKQRSSHPRLLEIEQYNRSGETRKSQINSAQR